MIKTRRLKNVLVFIQTILSVVLSRKITIKNPINKKDNTCFQYAVTVAFIYEKNWKKPEIISNMKPL